MTQYEVQDEDAGVWPPAIFLAGPVPLRPALSHEVRVGIASAVAAGAGLICGACSSLSVWTLYAINEDNFKLDTLIHSTYFAGLAFEAVGLLLGRLGRRANVGRIGLVLSTCVLCLMVTLTFVEHNRYSVK